MAQITYTNPNARRKRVRYTGSKTIKEGEPLCYAYQSTKNWFGYSDSAGAAGDTTAEGYQNEGKYIYVENPISVDSTTATWTQATKILTDNGAEFDNLQVGMFVSVASETDSDIDGVWEITAQSAADNTITLGNMTDAEAAAVTDAISDVTVKIDNIHSFAGVVAAGGWVGKTGPCELDIYVPNGAIVPVRNDQNCTNGRTILAIHSNEQHLTAPFEAGGRAVAVAYETVDTATTTGLCLAKLDPNMFIFQKGNGAALLVDDEDTGNIMPNQLWAGTAQASGLFSAFQIKGYQTAGNASTWDYGLALNSNADFSGGTITAHACGNGLWLNLGEVTISGGSIVHAARCGVYEGGDCTFTSCSILSALALTVQVATDPGTGFCQIYFRNDGAQALDAMFIAASAGAVLATACGADEAAHVIGFDGDSTTLKIPFIIDGTTYYGSFPPPLFLI